MKKNLVLGAFAMLAFAFTVSAQRAVNFTGTWNLDTAKSKLDTRMPIESQTLVVTQTATELKVEQTTKRPAPPADAPQGPPPGGGGRGGRGGGMMGGGDGTVTYALDGKAVESTIQGPMGDMKSTTTVKVDLTTISISRTFTTPMGDRTSTEKWSLESDGTLKIESTRPNREGGTDTTTKLFTKKE